MVLAAIGILAVATFILWGWGQAFRRALGMDEGTWPATVALGMAAIVFLGGILNLARIAHPRALVVVGAAGFVLAVLLSLRAFEEHARQIHRPGIRALLVTLLIGLTVVFTIATQLPPSVYNLYDDYQKYFAYPVRMLETGTVFGSPLSAMGVQTLGGQPFLDSFVVAFFPISYINGVDAVFGLFLCLVLASQFSESPAMTFVCVLSAIFIHPQYVNVSTLYCGSALIMTIAAISADAREGADHSAPHAAALGILFAALIAMKPIFLVFVAIHLAAMAVIEGVRWASRTSVATALFLSPWILVHVPHYLTGLRAHLPAPTPIPGQLEADSLNLFSLDPLGYGPSPGAYTLLIGAIAVCAAICFLAARSEAARAIACCASAVATFFVFLYILGPIHAGYEHSLRYYAPIAIGLAPAIFGWTANYATALSSKALGLWLPMLVAAIPLAAFAPSLKERVDSAMTHHSEASYALLATAPDYVEYNRRVLYGAERETIRAIQNKVPAGEPLLAWVNTPFYLDYQRNRIYDIDSAGIGNPWADLPPARFLMLDYNGYATRPYEEYLEFALDVGAGERRNALRTLDFIRQLEGLMRQGNLVYDNGEIRVVRLR